MDRPARFTPEQVLRGIQAYVFEHVDEKLVLDPDASVNEYRTAIEESHDCPLWFLSMLAEYFGFEFSEQRWVVWLQLSGGAASSRSERKRAWEEWQQVTAQQITVRKLAEHIAARAPGASFQPATILGVPCGSAGAFLGLRNLPEVSGKQIAPSTKLRNVLRGWRLRTFWSRSQWASGHDIPLLRPTITETLLGRAFAYSVFAGLSLPTGIGVMTFFDWQLPWAWIACFAALVLPCILLCLIGAVIDHIRNPLPDGVSTFGDLARLIASGSAANTAQAPK